MYPFVVEKLVGEDWEFVISTQEWVEARRAIWDHFPNHVFVSTIHSQSNPDGTWTLDGHPKASAISEVSVTIQIREVAD